jgi:Luciferase-like monooxygenase
VTVLTLFRGISVQSSERHKVINSIRSYGLQGNEGVSSFSTPDVKAVRTELERLFHNPQLLIEGTAQSGGFRGIGACGGAIGAEFYAARHNVTQQNDQGSVIEFSSLLDSIYVDPRDFLCAVFQMWDAESRKRRKEQHRALTDLYGPSIGRYFEAACNTTEHDLRIAMCNVAGFDREVVLAHHRNTHMFPKPVRRPLQVLVGGHQQVTLDRAVAHGQGWIPGWRPFDELEEWIRLLRQKAEAAGRDPASLIVAPQLSCLVAATHEEATKRYVGSGMVQHRKSLAYTGRDPELAMDNNLIGSAGAVLEKLDRLARAGVDHLACITFCVESREEYEEQVRFFAEEIMAPFRRASRPRESA